MTDRSADNAISKHSSSLSHRAAAFFGILEKDESGRKLLGEQDHRIEFDLLDGNSFHVAVKDGRIAINEEIVMPRRYDSNDVVHFQLQTGTLQRLFDGKIRFTDAFVPADQNGEDAMILLECTLLKWSVLNWVGRIFRGAQVREQGV